MSTATLTRPARGVKPRARQPRPKPPRSIRVLMEPYLGNPGLLILTVGKVGAPYSILPLPADFGRAFEVRKLEPDGDTYHVLLNGRLSTCECKGFLKHGRCKHLGGLFALQKRGRLPDAQETVQDAPSCTRPESDPLPDVAGDRPATAFQCNGCADRGYQPTAEGDLEACPDCQPAGRLTTYRSLGDAMRNSPESFPSEYDQTDLDSF